MDFSSYNDSRSDRSGFLPPNNDNIRQALARTSSASGPSGRPSPAPLSSSSRTSSSRNTPQGVTRRTSGANAAPQKTCDCYDCRDKSYRNKLGATRVDEEGNSVRDWDGDSAPPLHLHIQPGLFDEDDHSQLGKSSSSAGTRSSSGSSSSGRRANSNRHGTGNKGHSSFSKDSEGNLVEEWDGPEAPPLKPHYDWDAHTGFD
jgi:hypothetical protein